MVQGIFQLFDSFGESMVGSFELHKNFFNLKNYDQNFGDGMERILCGLVKQVSVGCQSNEQWNT